MKTKEELGEDIYQIFQNVERIHGKSEAIDWIKLASYRTAGWLIENLREELIKYDRAYWGLRGDSEKIVDEYLKRYENGR